MNRNSKMAPVVILMVFNMLLMGCSVDQIHLPDPVDDPLGIVSEVDSSTYNLGLLLYNADQGKEFWTEFNTQIRPYRTADAGVAFRRPNFKNNPYLECLAEKELGDFGVRMAFFKTLFDDHLLPATISEKITGLRFNAFGFNNEELIVEVLDANGQVIAMEGFELEPMTIKSYSMDFESMLAKEVVFYSTAIAPGDSVGFGLDDVYFKTGNDHPFAPPSSDVNFLDWLKRSSFNFFDWNYMSLEEDKGVVLESYTDPDKVTLSGLGYSYAIYVLAGETGYISQAEAKKRIKAMLRWQMDQNWFDGSGGWHGFPHHYFKRDGSYFWADVSTIDWAICAAGLRVVSQFYAFDTQIVSMVEELLSRPDWTAALAEDNKIAMGFDGLSGEMNDYRWGLAFSEETELVYLEAVASGDLDPIIFDAIVREKKDGFYPSWFGAGFTYNWLQLWTGPIEPFLTNAKAAFEIDASTCQSAFNQPLMGLTACSTVKEVRSGGFLNWNRYISNQGGYVHGSLGGVIQISPAPYGAALALPFTYEKAMTAMRTYVELGYFHEYLGLPDNVRINDLPDSIHTAPNWNPYDINIGPIIMAIEQVQENRIANLYLSDPLIEETLNKLIQSFVNG
jgi:hypothetical protein